MDEVEVLKLRADMATKVDLQMLEQRIQVQLNTIKTRITMALMLLAALSSGSHFISTDMMVEAVANQEVRDGQENN